MSHTLALGGRDPCDVGDNRFRNVTANKVGCLFLSGPADLTDHHNGLCSRVFLEQPQNIYKMRPRDRIATNANAGRLAVAHIGRLLDRFISQCARARDDTDLTGQVNRRRHDADFAFTGRNHTGAVGADQPHTQLVTLDLGIQHIQRWHAFSDADNQFDAGVCRLKNRILAKRSGHIDDRRIGGRLRNRLRDGIEYRQTKVSLSALPGGHTTDHFGAVGDRLFGVERALRTGEALTNHASLGINQNTHAAPPAAATTF